MKGINRQQHRALRQNLEELQDLLLEAGDDLQAEHGLLEVKLAMEALDQSYLKYEQMLDELAFHIIDYEELHKEIKVNCVFKMRELGRLSLMVKRMEA